MKKILLWMLPLLLMVTACEKDEGPGKCGEFIKIFGTTGTDIGNAVVETSDGGFALAGSQFVEGHDDDMVLIRTDADGILLWTKTYGDLGRDRVEDLLLLDDGGFLLVGTTATGSFGEQDVAILRTDAMGDVVWSKSYGGEANEEAFGVHILSDGGFAVVGYTESFSLGASTIAPQFYLVRTTAAGDLVWQRSHGGRDEDRANGLDIAADGSWIVSGLSYDSILDYQAELIHVSPDGDLLWMYQGISLRYDEAKAVIALPNGNFAWLGSTFINGVDFDLVVQVVDSLGHELVGARWVIGGGDNDRTLAKHFFERSDGAYVLPAYTKSKGKGANDAYLVVADGNRSTVFDETYGGSNDDIGAAAIPTSDGGYAIVGYTKSFSFSNNYDIVLLKTNGSGELIVD